MGLTKTELILTAGLVTIVLFGFGVWYTNKDNKSKKNSKRRHTSKRYRRDRKSKKRRSRSESESSYDSQESSIYSEGSEERSYTKKSKKKKIRELSPPVIFSPDSVSPVIKTPVFTKQIESFPAQIIRPEPIKLKVENVVTECLGISPIRS